MTVTVEYDTLTVTVEAADSIDVTADGYQSIMATESARSRLL